MRAKSIAFMREDDVLTVTKPDRLARSTAELLTIDPAEVARLSATMRPAAIAKHLGIARSSVYRALEAKTGA